MNKIIWKQEYLCMLYRRIRPLKDLAVKKKEYLEEKGGGGQEMRFSQSHIIVFQ